MSVFSLTYLLTYLLTYSGWRTKRIIGVFCFERYVTYANIFYFSVRIYSSYVCLYFEKEVVEKEVVGHTTSFLTIALRLSWQATCSGLRPEESCTLMAV